MSNRNIVLTGFMATGKSIVAHLLSERLNRPLVDMDVLIEERTGWSIPRMFEERGEPFFRAIEKGLCYELSLAKGLIVSTGGGALIDVGNREAFIQTSLVICLMARPETIEARLQQTEAETATRPLASRWRELYAQRSPVYQQFPHQIHTDNRTPEAIIEEIMTLWASL